MLTHEIRQLSSQLLVEMILILGQKFLLQRVHFLVCFSVNHTLRITLSLVNLLRKNILKFIDLTAYLSILIVNALLHLRQ